MTLDYAGRCERYARQRGWVYSPKRLSFGHLTARQWRRSLKKERHAWYTAMMRDPAPCSHCGGNHDSSQCPSQGG